MKTQQRTRVVKMSDENDIKDYSVELSADFFDILINNIYSDPISSIIREIGCNAYDSHVMNSNEKTPIKVHLPSSLEPYFYIKDQGVGLPEKKMYSLYTRLGASDKRNNNDTTGCKGIGSKSPFSYADNFTVESCFNGERKLYSCFIGEDGKPKIKTTFTADTNQPNGLMVQLPVKYNDFHTFEQKCMNVMQHFKVAPNIVGKICRFPERTIKLEGSCWRLYEQKNYESYAASAIMANVSYPLEQNSKILAENSDYSAILNSYIEIDFDTGDLNPAGGRERLQYDDRTVSKICQKIDIVNKDILKHIEDEVAKSTTLWEARCKFLNMVEGFYHKSTLKKMQINYNDEPLFPKGTSLSIREYRDLEKTVIDAKADFVYHLIRSSNKKYNYNEDSITPATGQVFVVNDIDAGGVSRAIQYCGDNIDYEVPISQRMCVYFISIEDPKRVEELLTFLGDPDTLLASELPKIRINRTKYEREPATKIQTFDGTKFAPADMWKNSDKTTADSGIYLEICRNKYKNNSGHFIDAIELNHVLERLATLGYKVPVIYGIKTAAMKQKRMQKGIEGDDPRWVCFWKYAIERLNRELLKFNVPLTLANNRVKLGYHEVKCLDKVFKHTTAQDIATLYKHIDEVKAGTIKIGRAQTIETLANQCKVPLDITDPIHKLKEELEGIKERYPLLKYCDYIQEDDLSHLGIYLNQVAKGKSK